MSSPDPKQKMKGAQSLKLTSMNESAQKKKRPFDYSEKEDGDKKFSLKNLNPEQMRELNNLLMQYIEVPRPHSDPRKVQVPSPDMRPEALLDQNLSEEDRRRLQLQQQYFYTSGQ